MKTGFLIIRFAFLYSIPKAQTKAVFSDTEITVWESMMGKSGLAKHKPS